MFDLKYEIEILKSYNFFYHMYIYEFNFFNYENMLKKKLKNCLNIAGFKNN